MRGHFAPHPTTPTRAEVAESATRAWVNIITAIFTIMFLAPHEFENAKHVKAATKAGRA